MEEKAYRLSITSFVSLCLVVVLINALPESIRSSLDTNLALDVLVATQSILFGVSGSFIWVKDFARYSEALRSPWLMIAYVSGTIMMAWILHAKSKSEREIS